VNEYYSYTASSVRKASFGDGRHGLYLMLLLSGDLGFIVLHLGFAMIKHPAKEMYSLGTEGGYPELYQYLKWFWMAALMARQSLNLRSWSYGTWGLLFAYLLFDDALAIHEILGARLAGSLALTPFLGAKPQDLGELIVTAAAGSILLGSILIAYWRAGAPIRRFSLDMALLLCGLAFFGIAMDLVHSALGENDWVNLMLVVFEDGGEMLVASVMLWFVFLHSHEKPGTTTPLILLLREMLHRN
jgi:hypothetical protein